MGIHFPNETRRAPKKGPFRILAIGRIHESLTRAAGRSQGIFKHEFSECNLAIWAFPFQETR